MSVANEASKTFLANQSPQEAIINFVANTVRPIGCPERNKFALINADRAMVGSLSSDGSANQIRIDVDTKGNIQLQAGLYTWKLSAGEEASRLRIGARDHKPSDYELAEIALKLQFAPVLQWHNTRAPRVWVNPENEDDTGFCLTM